MESLALLPASEREALVRSLTKEQGEALLSDWRSWARPKQLPPAGDWLVWMLLAGRGFGKTRSGAGWVHERAMVCKRWLALIAKTPADARDFMIEGPGGILPNTPKRERPLYEPSKRRLTWPNGSRATIYSDAEPDQTRGFSGDTAWIDELAKFRYPQLVWDNLQFGMREASDDQPRIVITTTPRPLKLLDDIKSKPGTICVVGSSYENRGNLSPAWFERTIIQYEGTRLGRQEIYAEILKDTPGALWTRRNLDECRAAKAPEMQRIVIGLDPPATGNEGSNEAGIIVAGLAIDKDGYRHGYTLDDFSCRGSPDVWGRKAVAAYRRYSADRIIAESNQGGEMVGHVLKSIDPNVPVTLVHASRGKYVRAEPVSALYEQGRIHHVGTFPDLEDQMVEFTQTSAGDRSKGISPDRVDALVWAYSHLFPQIAAKEAKATAFGPVRGGSFWST